MKKSMVWRKLIAEIRKCGIKRFVVLSVIIMTSLAFAYRIRQIRQESNHVVNNIVRIHREMGAPEEYVIAEKTNDFLREPIFIENGRALVSRGRVRLFAAGQRISGTDARITSVSSNLDLHTGMFVVRVSKRLNGQFFAERRFDGFFLPLEAILPDHARVISRDVERQVVAGLREGERVVLR